MTTERIFETATRSKLRFEYKGTISTEDIWNLSIKDLDSLYKILKKDAKVSSEDSLLNAKTTADELLALRIDIVTHIFNVKVAEANAKAKAKEVKEQKQKIMEVLAKKEDESLLNKTPEELKAMLESL